MAPFTSRRCRSSGSTRVTTSRASSIRKRSSGPTSQSRPAAKRSVRSRRISLVFEDPKNLTLEQLRPIRDEIKRSVEQLVAELDREATAA
jgi:hypothetical protein